MIGKISLALNVLLIAAVGYLFTKLPSDGSHQESAKEVGDSMDKEPTENLSVSDIKVAYILGDSINEQYKFLDDSKDELIRRSRRSEDKLRREMETLDNRYIELMPKQQTGGFKSQQEVMDAEKEFQERQMKLEEMQNEEAQNLSRYERTMNSEFFERMQNFLKRFSEENGIELVVNIQEGGSVLYSKESNNITSEVIKQLNAEYEEELASQKGSDE